MKVKELIEKLSKYDSDKDVRIMLHDATYDADGKIIESDNFRDSIINDVHDCFANDDGYFVSIEAPANDVNFPPIQLETERIVGESYYCNYNDCDLKDHDWKSLQRLRTHQHHRHGWKSHAYEQNHIYWKARAAAHRRGEKWVGQGLPPGWSKGPKYDR